MAALTAIVGLVGTGLQVMGTIQQGRYQEAALKHQALMQEARGKEELAAGQRKRDEKRREAEMVYSRQRAVAAASGAGATSPSVLDIYEDTAQQGEYLARVEQYGGESRKAGYMDEAAASRFKGKAARSGSILEAIGQGVAGVGRLYG